MKNEVPIWQKACLTIEEAAAYSGISDKTLRNRIKEQDYDFVLKLGAKTLIKRKKFEKFLEVSDTI
ncbi:MAG: helix-turn-helix domain-containing protein [Clostridiales bacterium]|nr:helix-turn-helix domain-containing protein [Clostridiales bacterium]